MSFKLGRADVDERQKVNLVSPFDIQKVPFGEWQETQVESHAELLVTLPHSIPDGGTFSIAHRFINGTLPKTNILKKK